MSIEKQYPGLKSKLVPIVRRLQDAGTGKLWSAADIATKDSLRQEVLSQLGPAYAHVGHDYIATAIINLRKQGLLLAVKGGRGKKPAKNVARQHPYYSSSEWRQRRDEAIERDGFRCRLCNAAGVTLQAHHRSYYHWMSEDAESEIFDLTTLCIDCHQRFHSNILDKRASWNNQVNDKNSAVKRVKR